jgi:tRNA dimethylallyltransferase
VRLADERPSIVVIAGPTATGKTRLAVDLALRFGGEVVNADSMQVYRGMNVGTAKPTEEEKQGVPHHLIDVVNPDETFNAAVYRRAAVPVIERISRAGLPCYVVGGSGLYIRALLGGLFDCPQESEELRRKLRRAWEEEGALVLHERLRSLDPDAAESIHPNDRVRVLRALEVIELTGQRFSLVSRSHGFRKEGFRALKICLHMERERLYERINRRARIMIENGLVEETRLLLKQGYSSGLKPMQSIGYRHALAHLNGDWDLETLVERLQADTRRYAKRQITWFRGDPEYRWRAPEDGDRIRREVVEFYGRSS